MSVRFICDHYGRFAADPFGRFRSGIQGEIPYPFFPKDIRDMVGDPEPFYSLDNNDTGLYTVTLDARPPTATRAHTHWRGKILTYYIPGKQIKVTIRGTNPGGNPWDVLHSGSVYLNTNVELGVDWYEEDTFTKELFIPFIPFNGGDYRVAIAFDVFMVDMERKNLALEASMQFSYVDLP